MIIQFLLFFIWHVNCKPFDDFESLSNVQFKIMMPCLTILIAKATFQSLKFGNLWFLFLISFKRYRSLFICKWINGTVNYYPSKKHLWFCNLQWWIEFTKRATSFANHVGSWWYVSCSINKHPYTIKNAVTYFNLL